MYSFKRILILSALQTEKRTRTEKVVEEVVLVKSTQEGCVC